MTDLWKFSETPILGGSSNEEFSNEEQEEKPITGGMSVADFFCRKRPESDSQRFTFFENLTVPFGLVYLPPCDEPYKVEESDEPKSQCENFDNLFSLSSKTLGKKEGNRKTRKKITQ